MIGFRVTDQMLLGNVLNNFNLDELRLESAQQKVATGKAINQPQDDPFGASQAVTFRQRMGLNTQLQSNLNSAKGWLDANDGALSSMTAILQRARELAVQGANDTLNPSDRQQIAREIHQLLLNSVDIANSKFGNEYIFAGTKTTVQPFTYTGGAQAPNVSAGGPSPVTYVGDGGAVTRQIDQAAQLQVNADGTKLATVFTDLSQLEWDLNNSSSRVSGQVSGLTLSSTTTSKPGAVDTFSINGVKIGTAVTATIDGTSQSVIGFAPNTRLSNVVAQINAQTNATGVTASLDRNGVLVLQLAAGATQTNIVVSSVDTVSTDAAGNDLTKGTGVPLSTGGSTIHDLGLSNATDNAIGSADLVAIDSTLDTVQEVRSQLGAKDNRVQEGINRLSGLGITLAALDSNIENVDMAKAISDLATAQTTFQAALSAAAKTLPPTLLDFLH
ncbi:MAG: flagellar hook-associated protein FlgL [Chloroflexota bacterium]